MAFGGQILRSDGTYWLTPDQTPLNMVKRQDVTYTSNGNVQYYDTGVATSRPCACFMRINTNVAGAIQCGYLIQRNGTWQYQLNGTTACSVRWYVFSNYVVAPTAYDIAYYNASGVAVWNGSSRPLQVFRATVTEANSVADGTVILDAGQPVAVTPFFSGSAVVLYIPGTPEYYMFGYYGFKAVGNQIKIDLHSTQEGGSGAGFVGYYISTCFYIRTTLYDY